MKRQGSSVWGDSSFGFPFRTYQRLILERIGNRLDEPGERETFHIVSPPGSGKTVLGIELARRLGERAVVFSPTTTIQRQWVDKAGMFEGPEDPPLASTDPTAPTPLIALTYQIVTTVGGDTDSLALAARAHWERELIAKEPDDAAAVVERLDLMLKNNKEAYNKEIRRRIAAVRREALRAPSVDLGELLHPNARAIIDGLVNAGVRTVVLDECHHLLDYWAIVIAYLIARIDRPRIIGLTATLPSPEDANTFENYEALLGDVTYEVPTPAVVKSGDLAPYRDLVAFTEPTADEATYLDGAMAQFHGAVTEILNDPSFSAWLAYGAAGRGESPRARWDWLLAQNTPLAVAMLRHASLAGLDLDGEWIAPPGNADVAVPMTRFPVPHQARQPATVNDTIAVLESFALGHLKVSADPLDRSRLAAIRDALKPFGYTLTESGLRQRRPIAESVLSYSAAKTSMAARILAQEETALAGRLRAVVVTDFEQTGSLLPADGTAYPRGSARRVFADFTRDPACHHLDPVLVTGKTLWIDADHGANLVAWFNTWLNDHGVDAHCEAGDHPLDTVIEVVGTGPGWRSGVYVRMVTAAFEAGLIRVLVGTRGLFAEGWDALTLNVLVDLTTAATSTATQQLRGRTLRKDPNWPNKVAHNWDVVCLPPNADAPPGGYTDLHRLERRHNSTWGILPEHGAMPEHVGRIVKSTDHVDTAIRPAARVLETPMRTTIHSPLLGASSHAGARSRLHEATERAWQEIHRREWSYAAWRIGEDYDNEASAVASMTRPSLPFRTVFTVTGTLRAMLVEFRYALLGLLATVIEIFAYTLNTLRLRGARGLLFVMGVTAVATVVMSGVAAVKAWRVYRNLMRGDHPDTVLKDVGRAVLLALRDLRLVSVECQPEDVLVIETPALDYEVRLSRASAVDADLFARSMSEALAPIDRQRYLISRNVAALPDIWLRPLWAALRRFAGGDAGITYHAVPEVLGSRKERAEVFQRHWNANVGRGRLIYTKNPEGFELLSAVRTRQQPESESSVYDVWR